MALQQALSGILGAAVRRLDEYTIFQPTVDFGVVDFEAYCGKTPALASANAWYDFGKFRVFLPKQSSLGVLMRIHTKDNGTATYKAGARVGSGSTIAGPSESIGAYGDAYTGVRVGTLAAGTHEITLRVQCATATNDPVHLVAYNWAAMEE